MQRWTSVIGVLMLVLMLWAGGAAHAAERFACIPVTAEPAGHFEGDEDQGPSSPDQGATHHHSGCNGHHVAAPTKPTNLDLTLSSRTVPLVWREAGMPGHSPDTDLRPPIA